MEINYNKFEHELLKEQLHRYNLDHVSNSYIKVSSYEYGKSLVKNINNFKIYFDRKGFSSHTNIYYVKKIRQKIRPYF